MQTLYSDSVTEIAEMIFNKAPLLMRCGGGPLAGASSPFHGHSLPEDLKQRIIERVAEGEPLRKVSAELGVGYTTVCRLTQGIRRRES